MTDDHRSRQEATWRKLAKVREQARATREVLREDLPAVSVAGASPDGNVRLSVNAEGVLTSLRLADDVTRLSAAEIANAILRTYTETQRSAAREATELLRSVGGNTYLQDRLAWRQEFTPEAQPETPAPQAQPPRAARPGRTDDHDSATLLRPGW